MTQAMKMIVAGVLLTAVAAPSWAADSLVEQGKAQNKLLAQRAARADAMRKLAERIKGLQITSSTTVQDFVTQSDNITTFMQQVLVGAREVGPAKYMEDGTCNVTMEVTLRDVIVSLKQIYDAKYKGDKVKITDIQEMTVRYEDKPIRETGSGAPRPDLPGAGDTVMPIPPGESPQSLSIPGNAKAYWMANVTGQGRLMAIRAARVDAMRKLAERIKGVQITSQTTVQDFVAESDQVNVDMQTFLRGAREVALRYHSDELIVDMEMEVTLRTVYASLKSWSEAHYKGDKVKLTQLEELSVRSEDKPIREVGSGVPPQQYLKNVKVDGAVGMQNPDWLSQKIRAVGNAAVDAANENKAQAKLMAFRGAELDARRKLAEQINGLMITSNTSVRDFVAQNDEINTDLVAFQQNARVVEGSQKLSEDGTAQVTVEMELKPVWDMVLFYQKKLSITIK